MSEYRGRYFLDRDQDGHWFVIPEFLEEKWFEWNRSWEYGEGDIYPPEGIEKIGGWPGMVRFKEYRIE